MRNEPPEMRDNHVAGETSVSRKSKGILKLGLYVLIALLSDGLQSLSVLDSHEKVAALIWTQWTCMGLSALLSGLVVWKAFLSNPDGPPDEQSKERKNDV